MVVKASFVVNVVDAPGGEITPLPTDGGGEVNRGSCFHNAAEVATFRSEVAEGVRALWLPQSLDATRESCATF